MHGSYPKRERRKRLWKFLLLSAFFHLFFLAALAFYFDIDIKLSVKSFVEFDLLGGHPKGGSETQEVNPKRDTKRNTKSAVGQSETGKSIKQRPTHIAKAVRFRAKSLPIPYITTENTSSNTAGEESDKAGFKALPTSVDGAASEGMAHTSLAYPDYDINPKPSYPLLAKRRGFEGVVFLKVYVLANGSVGSVDIGASSGYASLDSSALAAVSKWVFVPGNRNGKAIAGWVTVPIKFVLKKG